MPSEKIKEYSQVVYRWSCENITLLKGIAALIFGISLIYLSHRIIINLIVFVCGALLIYYGLVQLRLRKITNIIDDIVDRFIVLIRGKR